VGDINRRLTVQAGLSKKSKTLLEKYLKKKGLEV
jgi:hypothetical protein